MVIYAHKGQVHMPSLGVIPERSDGTYTSLAGAQMLTFIAACVGSVAALRNDTYAWFQY